MSESKTEKATPKKRRDAAKRGQSFKARDLVVACLMFSGVLLVVWLGTLAEIGAAFVGAVRSGFTLDLHRYAADILLLALKVVGPIILLSIVATAFPSLLQSGFSLASEAFKINFGALNPIKGFKKIFNLRTVKEFVKAVLYLCCFSAAFMLMWWSQRKLIFSQVHASIPEIIGIWGKLIISLVLICLGCIAAVLVLDALAELFLYLKELRMEKQEVKREYKELEGDPLMKSKRKQVHMEMLSEQEKHDIENSRMVIANPTHVAIGIYFKPELSPIPFISIRESNQRALAVRNYAEKVGVPVIVDIGLARRLYRTHRRYAMVSMEEIQPVVRLLLWLQQVEIAGIEIDVDTNPENDNNDAAKDSL
ncbi:EscU/YscU/HrcU family type III secretion system export apparatus switch protein [Solimicrobium silvestre]|uniref:Type III secretion protein, YscU/HrpY family n=1 Tax=Solimicrobium silvestre TaxID=2099400 RepID=A0A2S9H1N1_9BURK|nr:EscU/YscU/HrcU family type III secretion system export apparatus switch protein [Solimicrobium silvestre]PRC93867.1 Type III secretion protein, YscU/HrpY family [Solimicrobium silvestre]